MTPTLSSGTVIYKIHNTKVKHRQAQAKCDQDSADAAVSGFLHLPMPRNEVENQIYLDIIRQQTSPAWLDIVEVQPKTSPRTWVYKDGSPVTWFNWKSSEPNNVRGIETEVEMEATGKWNDHHQVGRPAVCTYFLPAGAENECTWLHEFED